MKERIWRHWFRQEIVTGIAYKVNNPAILFLPNMQLLLSGIAKDPRRLRSTAVVIPADKHKREITVCSFFASNNWIIKCQGKQEVKTSSGHRQFCLYDGVIKMSSWHNSWELIPAPNFCPSFFVYGCLVPWVPVPLKEDRRRGVWKSGNPESGIGTGIGTGTGTGTGIRTGMGRETYIKAGTTFTLI